MYINKYPFYWLLATAYDSLQYYTYIINNKLILEQRINYSKWFYDVAKYFTDSICNANHIPDKSPYYDN